MANVIAGAVGGFGPFDAEVPVGLTEYGGGSGLVEGSPLSQSGTAVVTMRNGSTVTGPGLKHVESVGETMSVDEKLGVMYRASRAAQEEPGYVDPLTDAVIVAAGEGVTVDPETGMTLDDLQL